MSAVLQQATQPSPGVELTGVALADEQMLTPAVLDLLAGLHRRFEPARRDAMVARERRQEEFDAGALPDFRADTAHIRAGTWTVAPVPPVPPPLLDRRVEITGPVDPKMVINALNSGANCYMADCEDSTSPTWANLLQDQRALRKAVAGTLDWTALDQSRPHGSKHYTLKPEVERAVLIVRPRGWHLDEKHVLVDGARMFASLFDLGLFCFHNAQALAAKDRGPYFYLPKLQAMEEAQLWDVVLASIESELGLAHGQIRSRC